MALALWHRLSTPSTATVTKTRLVFPSHQVMAAPPSAAAAVVPAADSGVQPGRAAIALDRAAAIVHARATDAKLARARELAAQHQQRGMASRQKCPAGCTRRGNCDQLTGQCSCPFTHGGSACDRPLMPACELPDGETVNLSFLSSEKAWQSLRDVANNGRDRRRSSPPFLWLGVITCDCVLQAIRALSLETSPMPHRWPSFIEFPFVSLQRVACVDTPLRVGELWDRGHGSTAAAAAAARRRAALGICAGHRLPQAVPGALAHAAAPWLCQRGGLQAPTGSCGRSAPTDAHTARTTPHAP